MYLLIGSLEIRLKECGMGRDLERENWSMKGRPRGEVGRVLTQESTTWNLELFRAHLQRRRPCSIAK